MQSAYGTMSVEVPMKAVVLVLVDLELETFGSPSEKIGISYLSMRLRGCLGCGGQHAGIHRAIYTVHQTAQYCYYYVLATRSKSSALKATSHAFN